MSVSYEEGRKKIESDLEKVRREKEESIERIRNFVSDLPYVDGKIKGLSKILPPLDALGKDAETLSNTIVDVSATSDKITDKIRSLDAGRVAECQRRVADLIDLETCSRGVLVAIRNEEYEKAAGHVHRFLSMDQSLLKKTATDLENVSGVLQSVRTLREAASDLRVSVQCKFEEAVRKEDSADIERFFKIFPLLGMHDEGIAKFCDYLCSKLEVSTKKNLATVLNTPKTDKRFPIVYSDALTLLFEGVAATVEQHQPLVETFYGPGRLFSVFEAIQKRCDSQTHFILQEFYKSRQMHEKMRRIGENRKAGASFTKSEKIDPKDLDLVIQEITIMHARIELYIKFMKKKISADVEVSGGPRPVACVDRLIADDSDLSKNKHELLSYYLRAERYFMEESIAKAVNLDATEPSQITSSMVDDVFFIIRKCVRRAICGGSLDGVCAVINNACDVLEKDYCSTLTARLKQGYPSGYLDLTVAYNVLHTSIQQGRLQSAAGDAEHSRTEFLVALNDADSSIEYVETLCDSILMDVERAFDAMNSNERGKLESCLSGLSGVTANLRQVIDYGLQQLRSSAIKPRINPWVDAFLNINHQMTEDELSAYEADEPFVNVLIMNLSTVSSSFKDLLTASNYEALLEILASEVVARLEKDVLKSTFNRLGGLSLDKEVRTLASFLTSATSWSVREKFARLTQIATLLNLEKVTEIYDYWGSHDGSLTWRLTAAEVRTVLGLRTDFKVDEIKRLKLYLVAILFYDRTTRFANSHFDITTI